MLLERMSLDITNHHSFSSEQEHISILPGQQAG